MTALELTLAIPIPIDAPKPPDCRRVPPYGRELLAELAKGRVPNVYVHTGPDAWELAERRRIKFGSGSALVMPSGENPAAFNWPALDSCFVDARSVSRLDAVRIGAAIVAAGTRFVALLGPKDEPMAFRRAP